MLVADMAVSTDAMGDLAGSVASSVQQMVEARTLLSVAPDAGPVTGEIERVLAIFRRAVGDLAGLLDGEAVDVRRAAESYGSVEGVVGDRFTPVSGRSS